MKIRRKIVRKIQVTANKRIYIINRITELSVTVCHEIHILAARWLNGSCERAVASVRPFGAIKKNCHFPYFIIICEEKRLASRAQRVRAFTLVASKWWKNDLFLIS